MDADDRRRALVEAGIAITSELSLDAVLVTANVAHMARVPRLRVEDW